MARHSCSAPSTCTCRDKDDRHAHHLTTTRDDPSSPRPGLLEERTERLAPLYDTALRVSHLGLPHRRASARPRHRADAGPGPTTRGGSGPVLRDSDADALAGNAAGVIDLAIIWFMIVPVVAVIAVAGRLLADR